MMTYGIYQNGWMIGKAFESVIEAENKITEKYGTLFSNLEVKQVDNGKSEPNRSRENDAKRKMDKRKRVTVLSLQTTDRLPATKSRGVSNK